MTAAEFYAALGIYSTINVSLLAVIFGIFRSRMTQMENDLKEVEQTSRNDLERVLVRIESKIDTNEERSSQTRHEIRDQVQSLKLRVEVAIAGGTLGKHI